MITGNAKGALGKECQQDQRHLSEEITPTLERWVRLYLKNEWSSRMREGEGGVTPLAEVQRFSIPVLRYILRSDAFVSFTPILKYCLLVLVQLSLQNRLSVLVYILGQDCMINLAANVHVCWSNLWDKNTKITEYSKTYEMNKGVQPLSFLNKHLLIY